MKEEDQQVVGSPLESYQEWNEWFKTKEKKRQQNAKVSSFTHVKMEVISGAIELWPR